MARRLSTRLLLLIAYASGVACPKSKDQEPSKPAHRIRAASGRPCLIFSRKVDGHDRFFVLDPESDGEPAVILAEEEAEIVTLRAIRGGSRAIALVKGAGSQTLRSVDLGTKIALGSELATGVRGRIVTVNADGAAVLLDEDTGKDEVTTRVLRLGEKNSNLELRKFRQAFGGDLSDDGTRVVFAGAPTSCTASWIGKCPIEVHAASIRGDEVDVTPIAFSPTAYSYMPRFVPGDPDRVFYQTTERDSSPTCTDVNSCQHDVVVRSFLGKSKPKVIRENSFGVAFAPGGRRLVVHVLNDPETGCTRLPCLKSSLYLGTLDSDSWTRVVTADVSVLAARYFSPDGRWIAWRAPGEKASRMKVRLLEGGSERVIDDAWPQAWIYRTVS